MIAAVEARGWFYILGARPRRTKEVRDLVLSDTGGFETVGVARQRSDPMELQVKEVTVNDTPCKGSWEGATQATSLCGVPQYGSARGGAQQCAFPRLRFAQHVVVGDSGMDGLCAVLIAHHVALALRGGGADHDRGTVGVVPGGE